MDNMYTYTVPVYIKMLGGLKTVLRKAKEHGVDETALLNDRLAPDMFPFVKQVQITCDQAKGAAARLAGIEVPKFDDNETTLDELQARIDKTIDFLKTVSEDSFADAADRKITITYFPGKYMSGFDYAREYAIPNFYFHLVIAYGLVRKNGVQIGKADYTQGLPFKDLA